MHYEVIPLATRRDKKTRKKKKIWKILGIIIYKVARKREKDSYRKLDTANYKIIPIPYKIIKYI